MRWDGDLCAHLWRWETNMCKMQKKFARKISKWDYTNENKEIIQLKVQIQSRLSKPMKNFGLINHIVIIGKRIVRRWVISKDNLDYLIKYQLVEDV